MYTKISKRELEFWLDNFVRFRNQIVEKEFERGRDSIFCEISLNKYEVGTLINIIENEITRTKGGDPE